MSFEFDHTYMMMKDCDSFFNLKDRGFSLDTNEVEHPGALRCRFIRFPCKNPPQSGRKYQYLEFAEITDEQEHRRHSEKTKGRPLSEPELLTPGFSLRHSGGLRSAYERLKNPLKDLEIEFEHKNYDWKQDSVSQLPGWNFLTFKKSLLPGIYIWATEYELRPIPLPQSDFIPHPNSARHIVGAIWGVKTPELFNVHRLLEQNENTARSTTFSDGFQLWTAANTLGDSTEVFSNKTTPYLAIVIECTSLETFKAQARPDYALNFNGRNACGLRFADTAWDILVVEG